MCWSDLHGWFLTTTLMAGCAVVSRSPGSQKPSYQERDEAAKAACRLLWQREPLAQEYEYCGTLYWDGTGIRIGFPETNRKATGCWPSDPPEATELLARYHSHRINAEPSREDRALALKYPELGHYLCSPSGVVRRFSAEEGTVIVR